MFCMPHKISIIYPLWTVFAPLESAESQILNDFWKDFFAKIFRKIQSNYLDTWFYKNSFFQNWNLVIFFNIFGKKKLISKKNTEPRNFIFGKKSVGRHPPPPQKSNASALFIITLQIVYFLTIMPKKSVPKTIETSRFPLSDGRKNGKNRINMKVNTMNTKCNNMAKIYLRLFTNIWTVAFFCNLEKLKNIFNFFLNIFGYFLMLKHPAGIEKNPLGLNPMFFFSDENLKKKNNGFFMGLFFKKNIGFFFWWVFFLNPMNFLGFGFFSNLIFRRVQMVKFCLTILWLPSTMPPPFPSPLFLNKNCRKW